MSDLESFAVLPTLSDLLPPGVTVSEAAGALDIPVRLTADPQRAGDVAEQLEAAVFNSLMDARALTAVAAGCCLGCARGNVAALFGAYQHPLMPSAWGISAADHLVDLGVATFRSVGVSVTRMVDDWLDAVTAGLGASCGSPFCVGTGTSRDDLAFGASLLSLFAAWSWEALVGDPAAEAAQVAYDRVYADLCADPSFADLAASDRASLALTDPGVVAAGIPPAGLVPQDWAALLALSGVAPCYQDLVASYGLGELAALSVVLVLTAWLRCVPPVNC